MQRLSVRGLNAPYDHPCDQSFRLRIGLALSGGDLSPPYRSDC